MRRLLRLSLRRRLDGDGHLAGAGLRGSGVARRYADPTAQCGAPRVRSAVDCGPETRSGRPHSRSERVPARSGVHRLSRVILVVLAAPSGPTVRHQPPALRAPVSSHVPGRQQPLTWCQTTQIVFGELPKTEPHNAHVASLFKRNMWRLSLQQPQKAWPSPRPLLRAQRLGMQSWTPCLDAPSAQKRAPAP